MLVPGDQIALTISGPAALVDNVRALLLSVVATEPGWKQSRAQTATVAVKVKNTSDETLTLFWADDEEKTVKAGKTVEVRMASGDEIYAAAGAGDDAETVWGPETFRKQKSFTIDGDLSNWNSPASSRLP